MTSQSWIKVLCTLDVHHVPVLHLNTLTGLYSVVAMESLEGGIHGLCIPVISFDLRCESLIAIIT